MSKTTSAFVGMHLRAKNIRRWPLMACFKDELLSTHIYETAIVGHLLGTIARDMYKENIHPDRVCALATFHEGAESAGFGDMPSPVKYRHPNATRAFKALEREFEQSLIDALPEPLKQTYTPLIQQDKTDPHVLLAKAADVLCALIKCQYEVEKQNNEFGDALKQLQKQVDTYRQTLPAVRYFCEVFLPCANSTLDQQAQHDNWVENAAELA